MCSISDYLKISESPGLNGFVPISNCFPHHQHQQYLQQIDHYKAENSKVMHRPDSLPNWIANDGDDPQSKLSEYIEEVKDTGKNKCCHHLNDLMSTRRRAMMSLLVCHTK